jgi:hypothetical protein
MSRNVKTDFLAIENRIRQLTCHQFFQQNFLARAVNFQSRRQGRAELHDAVIKEGRPNFKRMSHAHPIGFGENVIGKKIFLIKPEVRTEIIAGFK